MLFLSKKFHLQHKLINRCLNGLVISCTFVVMSGCENIRVNDISASGNKTLFYFASQSDDASPASDQSAADLSNTALVPEIEPEASNVLALDIHDATVVQIGEVEQVEQVEQAQLSSGAMPELTIQENVQAPELDASLDENVPVSGFGQWLSGFFDSDSEKVESDDVELAKTDRELKSDASSTKEASQNLLTDAVLPDDALSNAQWLSKINALNVSEPTAAGQASSLDSLVDNAEKNDKLGSKTISKRLKRAMASATLEIVQWQLDMQKNTNDGIECRLSSPTLQLDSRDYTTQLWFNIEDNRLYVNATTDINPMHPEVGIYLDNGLHQPFSSKPHPFYVAWEGDIEALLKENQNLKFVISGNDLQSELQLAAINLASLRKIYPRYQSCTKRLLG